MTAAPCPTSWPVPARSGTGQSFPAASHRTSRHGTSRRRCKRASPLATTTTPAPGSALRAIAALHARLVLSGLSSNVAAVQSAKTCSRSSRTLPTTTASPARASTACNPACADDDHRDGDGCAHECSRRCRSPTHLRKMNGKARVRARRPRRRRWRRALRRLADSGDAAPEWLGGASPDVRDHDDDRSTELTMIASLCASTRLPSGQPSPARRGRATACRRRAFPPSKQGWP